MYEEWKVKTICGAAGGVTGEAEVNLKVFCLADKVEQVRSLVSAAPDLLEACKMMIDVWDNIIDPVNDASIQLQVIADAIAKAEGKEKV